MNHPLLRFLFFKHGSSRKGYILADNVLVGIYMGMILNASKSNDQ